MYTEEIRLYINSKADIITLYKLKESSVYYAYWDMQNGESPTANFILRKWLIFNLGSCGDEIYC